MSNLFRPRVRLPQHDVQNEDRYLAAAAGRIKANAYKTGRAKFDAFPDADAIAAYLLKRVSPSVYSAMEDDPRKVDGIELGFIDACYVRWQDVGCPSDKQIVALRRSMARDTERRAERAAKDAASSTHVGEVGGRIEVEATVTFQTSFESMYGFTYVTGFRDAAGNVYVHKGTPMTAPEGNRLIARGDRIRFKGTVKEHGVRDGVKQTVIARPKLLAVL